MQHWWSGSRARKDCADGSDDGAGDEGKREMIARVDARPVQVSELASGWMKCIKSVFDSYGIGVDEEESCVEPTGIAGRCDGAAEEAD